MLMSNCIIQHKMLYNDKLGIWHWLIWLIRISKEASEDEPHEGSDVHTKQDFNSKYLEVGVSFLYGCQKVGVQKKLIQVVKRYNVYTFYRSLMYIKFGRNINIRMCLPLTAAQR